MASCKGVKKMKMSIHDFIVIFAGFIYGIYEIFIDDTYIYIKKIIGVLSLILAIWILISCITSRKDKTER
jgi:hypothetical protein